MDSDNDNLPVFDRRDHLPILEDDTSGMEWTPARTKIKAPGVRVAFPGDRDPEDIETFIARGKAWYSSASWDGKPANDNLDWPLGKLLRAEGNDKMLAVAERYRKLQGSVEACTELKGQNYEAGEFNLSQRSDFSGHLGEMKLKGVRKVKRQEAESQVRRNAAQVPRKWNGDAALLAKVDNEPILSRLRHALGPIVDDFENAVCGNATLEQIGRRRGVGNATGAKGAGRALVFLGFTIVDQELQQIDAGPKTSRIEPRQVGYAQFGLSRG